MERKTIFKKLGEIEIGDIIVLPSEKEIKVAGVGSDYGKHYILTEDGEKYPTGYIDQDEKNIEVILKEE